MALDRLRSLVASLPRRAWDGFRRLRVVTLVAVTVVAVLTVTVVTAGDGDGGSDREGSEELAARAEPIAPDGAPDAYRIVYRIENRAAGELEVRTEEVTVVRPFDGRAVEREGEPPGSGPATVTVTQFGLLGVESPTAEPVVLNVPPNPPVADNRPAAMLEAAVDAGYAERRERREIETVGRECTVYRVGGPIGGGALTPLEGTDEPAERAEPGEPAEREEYADLCVGDEGLLLEEVWVVESDRVLRRRLAVEVDPDPTVAGDAFELPDAEVPPADQGGGSVLEVRADSRPQVDTFYELAGTPTGFRHRGRYAVIPPQAENFADPTRHSQRLAAVTDVWVRGGEFVAVEQGGTLGQVDPFEAHPHARPVDAGVLGESELILGFRTSEIRHRFERGRFVRVYGPVPPETLLEFAERLEAVEGGELVYLDEPPGASTGG